MAILIDTEMLRFYVGVLITKKNADEVRTLVGEAYFSERQFDLSPIDHAAHLVKKVMLADDSLAYVVGLAVDGAPYENFGGRHDAQLFQKVFDMHAVEKKSYKEIARILKNGMDKEAVRKTYHRMTTYLNQWITCAEQLADDAERVRSEMTRHFSNKKKRTK